MVRTRSEASPVASSWDERSFWIGQSTAYAAVAVFTAVWWAWDNLLAYWVAD